jgi:hypothetical protein
MGDDPFVPLSRSETTGHSSNANNYFINNLGKPAVIIMVTVVGMAMGLAIGAVVMMAWGQSSQRAQIAEVMQASERRMIDQIAASEKRSMDMAALAEREARIAQDKYTYTMGELAKKGIFITTDGH